MGARYSIIIESRKSRKSRKSHARYFGRISQSREIQKVRDFRNPTLNIKNREKRENKKYQKGTILKTMSILLTKAMDHGKSQSILSKTNGKERRSF